MTSRSALLRIHDMLQSIEGIEQALASRTYQEFEKSWILRSAVERGIKVISEASRHLSADLKARHPEVRWYQVAGIGNILRHDYQRVESAVIWKAAKDEFLLLKLALLAIQASLDD